jgi:hypothetical protein
MSIGKVAAQACHASVAAAFAARHEDVSRWLEQGQTKVVLQVPSLEALLALQEGCRSLDLCHELISVIARSLQEQFPESAAQEFTGWSLPPLNVLDCILSLNRHYEKFCLPRVQKFAAVHPKIQTLGGLRELIESHSSLLALSVQELNYRDERRAETLLGLIKYLIVVQGQHEGATEAERLGWWARSAKPEDAWSVGVRGFGLAGFQYLRMLFGAQTVKPDIHIRRFVSETIGRAASDIEAIRLIELAAQSIGRPIAAVDYAVWTQRSAKSAEKSACRVRS